MNKDHFFIALASFEGYRSKPYICPAGKKTIGYGHVILPNEHFTSLSLEEARTLLRSDFQKCLNQFGSLNIPLQEHEVFAISDLIFNIGFSAFKHSSLPGLLSAYSLALDHKNYTFAERLKVRISNKLLEFCHYHDKNGNLKVSSGLQLRCQFRKKVFLDQPIY